MEKVRILYVASEVSPFLQATEVSKFVRRISQTMQEKGMEIRIIAPKFGVINERKNRLHEVVRLSGLNISVGDDEKPLVIKVASVPNSRLQAYFIDNEDYFQRKSIFGETEKNKDEFFADNDERAIFFCRGTLETIKKLGWEPDIIHCNDWMSSLIPFYLKTSYRKDPVFKNTRSVFGIYNNPFTHTFETNLIEKIKTTETDKEYLKSLENPTHLGFMELGMECADAIVRGEEILGEDLDNLLKKYEGKKDVLSYETTDDEFLELYKNLHTEFVTIP